MPPSDAASPGIELASPLTDKRKAAALMLSARMRVIICEVSMSAMGRNRPLRSKPKAGDRGDDHQDEQGPNQARRFAEPEHADSHRADGADAAPDRISGAHRDRAGGELE